MATTVSEMATTVPNGNDRLRMGKLRRLSGTNCPLLLVAIRNAVSLNEFKNLNKTFLFKEILYIWITSSLCSFVHSMPKNVNLFYVCIK